MRESSATTNARFIILWGMIRLSELVFEVALGSLNEYTEVDPIDNPEVAMLSSRVEKGDWQS